MPVGDVPSLPNLPDEPSSVPAWLCPEGYRDKNGGLCAGSNHRGHDQVNRLKISFKRNGKKSEKTVGNDKVVTIDPTKSRFEHYKLSLPYEPKVFVSFVGEKQTKNSKISTLLIELKL